MNTILGKFGNFMEEMQAYRLPVMAGMILIHGCFTVPIALLAMLYSGDNSLQLLLITTFTFAILISNLAVLPTKITIPIFLVATMVHFIIIAVDFVKLFI